MAGLAQDLRFTYRTLVKSKGFTIVAVLALALGIGGTTVMYGAVDGILLRSLPYPESDRMVRMWESWKNGTGSVSYPNLLDWRAQTKTLEDLTGVQGGNYTLARGGEAERIGGIRVTSDFFALFGLHPILGHTLSRESYVSGNEVVITYELWKRSFGGDADAVGRTVRLSDHAYTVVGVLPRGFRMPYFTSDVIFPYVQAPTDIRGSHFLNVIARLAPGATLEQANAEMDHIAVALEAAYPDSNRDRRVRIRLWHESVTSNLRPAILLLFGAVILVLIIACANVANMLIARAANRASELAVRFALGASRGRVVRQLLTECLVLGLLGGGAGLLVAVWGVDACRALLADESIFDVALDARVVAFALGLSLVSVLAFGLLPALRAVRGDLASVMKEGGRTVVASRSRLRAGLVIVQVALSFALLVGAALLGRSFARLTGVDPGFDPNGVLTVQISLPPTKDPIQFYGRVLERLQALPEVTSAGMNDFLPLSPNNINGDFEIEGKTIDKHNESTEFMNPSADYFKTMGIPIVRGRGITKADGKDTERVAVINQRMAQKYFGDEDPIGKHLKLGADENPQWMTIVGIVGDVRRWSLDGTATPETYVPFAQLPWPDMSIVVRGHGNAGALAAAVRREVAAVDPDQAIFNVTTMTAAVDDSLHQRRILLDFTAAFGFIALALAAIGLYGVLAVQVAQRTHEIGIRMALGARPIDVRRMVVRNGLVLTVVGTVVGAGTALLLSSLLDKLLYAVGATDPATYVTVGIVLVVVAFFAAWIPARRATRIDPMIALRAQ